MDNAETRRAQRYTEKGKDGEDDGLKAVATTAEATAKAEGNGEERGNGTGLKTRRYKLALQAGATSWRYKLALQSWRYIFAERRRCQPARFSTEWNMAGGIQAK